MAQQHELLISNVRPVALGAHEGEVVDILIDGDGKIVKTGKNLPVSQSIRRIDGNGAWISPGWADLHAHIWHGGTDISVRPLDCGVGRGVTTLVDAGSAGEANFHGLREFIIEPAIERIKAFLNIGTIGLVACNRVSELSDINSIDIDRIAACYEQNKDLIVGLKVRASHVITGSWGITPVKVAKKLGKILKIPLMVHVGEPPALYDEVLEVLGPGDIITHCFNGKLGSSLIEDEDLFQLAERCAGEGIRLDIGHGGASFSFRVAEIAIQRGLLPFSISTDVHLRSMNQSVWDLSLTMSKLLSVGMGFEAVIRAVTHAPAEIIGLDMDGLLIPGARSEFTIFDLVDSDVQVTDSLGHSSRLNRLFEPRFAIIGTRSFPASRYQPDESVWQRADHSHGYSYR